MLESLPIETRSIAIRILVLGFLDVICRYSYQYIGWVSYIVRILCLTFYIIVDVLPYDKLKNVLKFITVSSQTVILWFSIDNVISKYGLYGLLWTLLLCINAFLQTCITIAILYKVEWTKPRQIAFYLYSLAVLGVVLQVVPEWTDESLFIIAVAYGFIRYYNGSGYPSLTEKIKIVKYYFERQYNQVRRFDYEFPVYFICMNLFAMIKTYLTISTSDNWIVESFGISFCTVISLKSVESVIGHSTEFIYHRIQNNHLSTEKNAQRLVSFQYYIKFLLLFDMLFIQVEPFYRGEIALRRVLFIFSFCLGTNASIFVMNSFEENFIKGKKQRTIMGLLLFSCISCLTMTLTYSTRRVTDLGLFITFTNTLNFTICLVISATGLLIYSMVEQGYIKSVTILLLNIRIITATVVILIDLGTLGFSVWIVLFGYYHWSELLCLLMVFENVICLNFLNSGLMRIDSYAKNKRIIETSDRESEKIRNEAVQDVNGRLQRKGAILRIPKSKDNEDNK